MSYFNTQCRHSAAAKPLSVIGTRGLMLTTFSFVSLANYTTHFTWRRPEIGPTLGAAEIRRRPACRPRYLGIAAEWPGVSRHRVAGGSDDCLLGGACVTTCQEGGRRGRGSSLLSTRRGVGGGVNRAGNHTNRQEAARGDRPPVSGCPAGTRLRAGVGTAICQPNELGCRLISTWSCDPQGAVTSDPRRTTLRDGVC